jgi:LemA protein
MTSVLIVIAVIAALLIAGAVAYNSLVRRRNRTSEAWSQIDVELKRRHDLIPNLVNTVKGYATHESSTFEAVTASRASAISAGASSAPGAVASAEDGLSRSLRSLFAVAENYPALRAQEGFLALQEQLAATEDKLEYARRYYNGSARDYNTAVQSLPRSLLAGPLGFHVVEFFQTAQADRETPVVDFVDTARPSAS